MFLAALQDFANGTPRCHKRHLDPDSARCIKPLDYENRIMGWASRPLSRLSLVGM
jgi:hypothetical protein